MGHGERRLIDSDEDIETGNEHIRNGNGKKYGGNGD